MGAYPGIKAQASGASTIINVSPGINVGGPIFVSPSWSLGLVCTVSAGASLTYSVQVTADQVPSSTGNWNNHDTLTGLTASANGNVAYPITGLRLNLSSYASGSVNLGTAQWP